MEKLQDNFNILISLIEKKQNNDTNSYNRKNYLIEQLLNSIQEDTLSFMHVYENLTEEQKPIWNVPEEDYCPFRSTLFNVIKRFDDKKFNDYFFKGFDKIIPIGEIRKEAIKRKDNIQLQQLIRKIDKPKSIDKLMDILLELYDTDNQRFNEVLLEYKDSFKKLNTIKGETSRTLQSLNDLLNYERKQRGLTSAINLADKFGYNFMDSAIYLPDGFKIAMYDKIEIEETDIEGLEILFKRYSHYPKHWILLKLTNLTDPVKVMNLLMEKDMEQANYFWNIFESYIKEIPKNNRIYKSFYNNVDIDNCFQILKNILSQKSISENLKMYNHIPYSGGKLSDKEQAELIMNQFEIKIWECKLKVFGDKLPMKETNGKINKRKI